MCRASIYEARNKFSSLVKIAESGEPVELTRHEKPVAVIVSWEEWEERKPKESFFDQWEKLREEFSDVLSDPTWEGLVIEKPPLPDEEYDKKIAKMWGED